MAYEDFLLLVEDNADHADLILRALRKSGLKQEVVLLHDGKQALDFLLGEEEYGDRDASKLPRVVFLDLKLPKLSGLQVLKRLRSEPLTRLLPIVMLTTSDEERDIVESYDLGVNSYVRKPVNFQDFNDLVRDLGVYWLQRNELS